jgi:integrase
LIIEAFERDFPFYAPLVKFCFFTGCRPSEAIAVEWKDLRGKRLTHIPQTLQIAHKYK